MFSKGRVCWLPLLAALVCPLLTQITSCSDDGPTGPGIETAADLEWLWQNPLPQGNDLMGVVFTHRSVGKAVGRAGTILRTTDGGATWEPESSVTDRSLRGVWCTGVSTATAVGVGGTILRSRAVPG